MKRRHLLQAGLALVTTPALWAANLPSKAQVVVIGGGDGGATAAQYVRMRSNYKINVVLVEPNTAAQPGDEVLVRTSDGRAMVKVLDFRRGGVVQLSSINEEHRPITIDESDIERLHYIAAILKAGSTRARVLAAQPMIRAKDIVGFVR